MSDSGFQGTQWANQGGVINLPSGVMGLSSPQIASLGAGGSGVPGISSSMAPWGFTPPGAAGQGQFSISNILQNPQLLQAITLNPQLLGALLQGNGAPSLGGGLPSSVPSPFRMPLPSAAAGTSGGPMSGGAGPAGGINTSGMGPAPNPSVGPPGGFTGVPNLSLNPQTGMFSGRGLFPNFSFTSPITGNMISPTPVTGPMPGPALTDLPAPPSPAALPAPPATRVDPMLAPGTTFGGSTGPENADVGTGPQTKEAPPGTETEQPSEEAPQ